MINVLQKYKCFTIRNFLTFFHIRYFCIAGSYWSGFASRTCKIWALWPIFWIITEDQHGPGEIPHFAPKFLYPKCWIRVLHNYTCKEIYTQKFKDANFNKLWADKFNNNFWAFAFVFSFYKDQSLCNFEELFHTLLISFTQF